MTKQQSKQKKREKRSRQKKKLQEAIGLRKKREPRRSFLPGFWP